MAIFRAEDYLAFRPQPYQYAWIDEVINRNPEDDVKIDAFLKHQGFITMFEEVNLILDEIPKDLYSQKSLTGSYYITDKKAYNDIDYILYTDTPRNLVEELKDRNYKRCGNDEYPEGVWASYRLGPLNIIITDNYQYYIKFCAATQLARVLDLQTKAERIKLFDLVLTDLNDKVVF